MTLARDASEERLLRAALSRLAQHRMAISVADGGSADAFVEFVRDLPGCRLALADGTRGLVPQIKRSLRSAAESGTSFILYTEPDKLEFFDRHLDSFIDTAAGGQDDGVLLASRSDSSFRTFPPLQQLTEGTINRLCAEMLGSPGDYSYGPFLMNRKLVPCLADVHDEVGWGWRHFVFGASARLGYPVGHVVGDFDCPPDQREENRSERLHRIRQLDQNIQGLLLSQADRPR
jgi:hypothetical protein